MECSHFVPSWQIPFVEMKDGEVQIDIRWLCDTRWTNQGQFFIDINFISFSARSF